MPTTKDHPTTKPRQRKARTPAATPPGPTSIPAGGPTVEIQTRAPEWAMAIRSRASVTDIPRIMAQVLPEAWSAAERLGLRAVMPFARYLSFEASDTEIEPPLIEFEAGVLVDGLVLHGEGRVEPIQLPGGDVAVACHVGPYELLSQTYDLMQRWIIAHERVSSGPMWEVYLDDPETTPVAELRTEVVIPLVGMGPPLV